MFAPPRMLLLLTLVLLLAMAVDGKPREIVVGRQIDDVNATGIPTSVSETEAPSSEIIDFPTESPSKAEEESATPTMLPSSSAPSSVADPTVIDSTPAPSVSTDAPTEAPSKSIATAAPTAMFDNKTPAPSSVLEDVPTQSPSVRTEETAVPTIATINETEAPVAASPTNPPVEVVTSPTVAPTSNTTVAPSSTIPGTTPTAPAPTEVPTSAPTTPRTMAPNDNDDDVPVVFSDRNETMDDDGFDEYDEFDDDDVFLEDKNETLVPTEDVPTLFPDEEDFDFNATDAPTETEDIQPDVTVPPTNHTPDEIEIDGDIILTPSPTGSAFPTAAPTSTPTTGEDIETNAPTISRSFETTTPTVTPSTIEPSITATNSPTTAAPTINVNFVQLPTDVPTPSPTVDVVQPVPTEIPTIVSIEEEKPSCLPFSNDSPVEYPSNGGDIPLTPHHQYMVDNVVRPTSSGLPGSNGEVGCDEPLPNQGLPVADGPVQTSAFLPGQRRLRGRQP